MERFFRQPSPESNRASRNPESRSERGRAVFHAPTTTQDVRAYLMDSGHESILKTPTRDRKPHEIESILQTDLHAKIVERNENEADDMRRLILADSSIHNQEMTIEGIRNIVRALLQKIDIEINESEQYDQADIEFTEALEEKKSILSTIPRILAGHRSECMHANDHQWEDEEMRKDIRHILTYLEGEYRSYLARASRPHDYRQKRQREQFEHELNEIRLIRDALYTKLFYPFVSIPQRRECKSSNKKAA